MRTLLDRSRSLASLTLFGFTVVGAPLLAGVSGCSSGSGSGSSDFAAQFCDIYMTCCAKAGLPTSGVQCRAIYGALASGPIDSAKANQCLNELRAIQNKPDFCPNGGTPAETPSCQGLNSGGNTGTAKPGDPCTKDSECAASSAGKVHCQTMFTSGSTTKYCQVQVVGKEGDGCGATIDGNSTSYMSSDKPVPTLTTCDTKDSLYCAQSFTSGAPPPKCTKIADIGGACDGSGGSYACKKGSQCDFTSKTCKALPAIGEACTGSCAAGAYCDTSSGSSGATCKATVPEGSACTTFTMCSTGNCTNNKCAKNADLTSLLFCGSS